MSTRKVIHIADDGSEHDSANAANRHDRAVALCTFISNVTPDSTDETMSIAVALLDAYNVSKKKTT